MEIKGIQRLINELVSDNILTKSQKNSMASKIKKQYGIAIQNQKAKGKIFLEQELEALIRPLMENYDKVKDLSSINETMQAIARDYKMAHSEEKKDYTKIENIYATILGNPGTSVDGMCRFAN